MTSTTTCLGQTDLNGMIPTTMRTMTVSQVEARYECLIAGHLADILSSLRELTPDHIARLKNSPNPVLRYMVHRLEQGAA